MLEPLSSLQSHLLSFSFHFQLFFPEAEAQLLLDFELSSISYIYFTEEVPAAVAEAPSHLFNDLSIYPCHISSIQVFPEIRTSARTSASSIQSSHDLMTESETIQRLADDLNVCKQRHQFK